MRCDAMRCRDIIIPRDDDDMTYLREMTIVFYLVERKHGSMVPEVQRNDQASTDA